MPDQPFPARLRSLMDAAGLTAPELARRAGLSRQVVNYYLSGQRQPHGPQLQALADALGGSLSLFDGCFRKADPS